MKAIRIASTGGLEVLESDYVRTHKEPTAIIDVVFEMYITKELEVLIKPAYALEDAGEAHRYLERRKSHRETPTFYRGGRTWSQREPGCILETNPEDSKRSQSQWARLATTMMSHCSIACARMMILFRQLSQMAASQGRTLVP